MNQYCYNIIADDMGAVDGNKVKQHIQKLYRKKKFGDLAFTSDEKIPFIALYSSKDEQGCIKMTSRAKKNIERIEEIHSALKAIDLKVSPGVKLGKPVLFELEQCAWWDDKCKIAVGDDQKWATLVHNGPYFTHIMEPYEPHGAPLIYDGEEYELTPAEERIANFYARRIISEQSGNVAQIWTEDKIFNKNFWMDFKKYLTPEHRKIFKNFDLVDFSTIVERLEELKEEEKDISDMAKEAKKVKTAERKQDYGYAVINGIKEPVGNFTIEPAAIFYGRGANPKRGKIKRDIEPKEVTINIQEGVKIPPPPGTKWKKVIHDHGAAWIASWKDPISNENKYVYLGAEGQLKGKSDFVKYEKARKLNRFIDRIRTRYHKDIKSGFDRNRQLGSVLYLIDNHGLRVGNEKDETETDTVGASTLRVEHVKLKPPDTIVFDFLGKDSIRYYKEIPVDKNVYDNFVEFLDSKKPSDPVFDLISAADINNYLKTFDKDFSAKVFRTRLASTVMDKALKEIKIKKKATQDDKKKLFTKANIQVAEILNHRRTVPPKSKDIIKKYEGELKDLRKQQRQVKSEGKSTKSLDTRIKKKRDQIEARKDTLNIAIATSLTNYIDPRLVVGWMKEHELNMPKVYTGVLQRKFKWAIDTIEPDWDYEETALLPAMAKLKPLDASSTATKKPSAKKSQVKKVPTKKPPIRKPITKKQVKKAPKKAPKKVTTKKPITFEQSELESPLEDVQIIDYSERSIVVAGDTKPFSVNLKTIGGRFNPNLTIFGEKAPGWVFSKTKLKEVTDTLGVIGEEIVDIEEKPLPPKFKTKPKPAKTYDQSELFSPNKDVSIIDYSLNGIAVIGDTKPYKDALKEIGGKFNRGLNVFDTKTPGWIFSKKRLTEVQEVLEMDEDETDEDEADEDETDEGEKKISVSGEEIPEEQPEETGESLYNIIEKMETLSQKERNIIKCFARDPQAIVFLKEELTGWNIDKKIFDATFLARFLSCLENYDKSPTEQEETLKNYQTRTYESLADELIGKLKPSTVPTYLFLIFILHKVSSRLREIYLQKLLKHISNKDAIQECLCENSEDDTLLSMETINDVPMRDLYLLPSGRCVHINDLIMHLKTSDNKMADPTYDKFKHGPKLDLTWTNGWELRMLLDRIREYDPVEGTAISKEFKKVLTETVAKIPQETKNLIRDTYVLFYFPETTDNEHLVKMLVKYGYPSLEEGKGDEEVAKQIVKQGASDELNEFRELLGFNVGHHVIEELNPDEREAVLFTGEFVGMGKEAWGKLSMGSFCTKTFGEVLHRMADVFAGKYKM